MHKYLKLGIISLGLIILIAGLAVRNISSTNCSHLPVLVCNMAPTCEKIYIPSIVPDVPGTTTCVPKPTAVSQSALQQGADTYDIAEIKNPNTSLKRRSNVIVPLYQDTNQTNLLETYITIKFTEGSGIRLRNNTLVSLTSQNLEDLRPLLTDPFVIKISRTFTRSEEELDKERADTIRLNLNHESQAQLSQLADLNLYYRIQFKAGLSGKYFKHVLDYLNKLDLVETAYIEPGPMPAQQ